MKAWVVRSGGHGQDQKEVSAQFWEKGVAAIGWGLESLSGVATREEIKRRLRAKYQGWTERKLGSVTGNIYRFVKEIAVGDLILTPPIGGGDVLIGRCAGPYEHSPGLVTANDDDDVRKATWLKKVGRIKFSAKLIKFINRPPTVADASEHIKEIQGLLK